MKVRRGFAGPPTSAKGPAANKMGPMGTTAPDDQRLAHFGRTASTVTSINSPDRAGRAQGAWLAACCAVEDCFRNTAPLSMPVLARNSHRLGSAARIA